MNFNTQTITLVSFDCEYISKPLLENLAKEFYNKIEVMSPQQWFSATYNKTPGLLILQIDNLTKWQETIISTLKTVSQPSILTILNQPDLIYAEPLISHCDEFMTAPFNKAELTLRINKLAPPVGVDDKQAIITDEFLAFGLVGKSKSFISLLTQTKKLANCNAPILIQGKTGTGKELFAKAIHGLSKKRNANFIPINCGSLPDQLFENELFGHEKGAFTDARTHQKGLIQQAEGGTLFLDEVDTLSAKAQVSLLRFLQDYTYRPLGSSQLIKANIRIIAATNCSLKEAVAQGRFREDLFYRLNILLLQIPSLKTRLDDIELLANHFIKNYQKQYQQDNKVIHPTMMRRMKYHDWPGNIRELENLLHRAFLLSENNIILDPDMADANVDLQTVDINTIPEGLSFKDAKRQSINAFEKNYLTILMSENEGNVSRAAKKSGKERRALGKLLKKYDLTNIAWETG